MKATLVKAILSALALLGITIAGCSAGASQSCVQWLALDYQFITDWFVESPTLDTRKGEPGLSVPKGYLRWEGK